VKDGLAVAVPIREGVANLMEESQSGWGRLRAVRHSAVLARTPAQWDRPSVPLGTHHQAWP
jgi:hypothetical protein